MEVIQPGRYQREIALLPGSRERSQITVDSLEELKSKLEMDQHKANMATRARNRAIIAISVLAVAGLLLYKHKTKYQKILKTLGIILSLGSIIKAAVSRPKFKVIEPKSSNLSRSESQEVTDLRSLAVKATVDTIMKDKLLTRKEVKDGTFNIQYNSKGKLSEVEKELVEYGTRI